MSFYNLGSSNSNCWRGKKILWLGTSIPGTGYPQMVGAALGAFVYNAAVGGSMVRAFKYTGSMVGLHYNNCLKALSHTVAEKQGLMDYWSSGLNASGVVTAGGTYGWKDLLTGTPPSDYTTFGSAATILGYSYENLLVAKYLNTVSGSFIAAPDLIVFDHGHNDLNNSAYDSDDTAAAAIPTTRNNRAYFCGAMNYLIDVIHTYNARAKIVIIGHYESKLYPRIANAQETLADYWDIPICRLWEKPGWSQQTVTTTGYWSNGEWVPSGGTSQTITKLHTWLEDNTHPNTTAAKQLIADNIAEFLKTVR
jgi:hypothetical protein